MRGVKKIFEEVIAKNIPNLMKTRRKYDGIYKVVKDKSSEPRINIQQNYPSKWRRNSDTYKQNSHINRFT